MPGHVSRKTKTANTIKQFQDDLAAARTELTAAKKSGNVTAIEAASAKVNAASDEITRLHTERFEAIVRELGRTATRAMYQMTKVCERRCYAITPAHRKAIMDALDASRADLDAALEAATRHKPIREGTARAIVFREVAHVS